MSAAKLTLLAFNSFMVANNDDLFSLLTLPEGIDKDTLTGNILLRGGEFEAVYSDPYFIQNAIGIWSSKWYRTFDKWITALALEYNPLENYDRMEDWTDTGANGRWKNGRVDSGNTRTFNNQDKRTLDTTNERTLDTTNERTLDTQDEETLNTQNQRTLDTTETSETTVSAYDSSSYQPSQKVVTENDGTDTMNNTGTDTFTHTGTDTMVNTGTDTMVNSGTDTVDYSGTIKDEYGQGYSDNETENTNLTHTGRLHGNIGVTTSQQMLESELSIAEWNIYEHITDLFLSEFVIPIYS